MAEPQPDDEVTQSEEEEEEEDESEADDSSEEEQEPKLKYERIENKLPDILNKEAASCIAVHTKFLAIGTHWGTVHVLDHEGNKIEGKEIAKHLTTVNQLSLERNANYIASCADDGKVAITGLYEAEHDQIHDFDCPIKSVALDPKFSQHNSNRQFVTGGDKLVLHEKGFLGRNKSTILHQGEGTIRNIQWYGDLIAWGNDHGVRVYDTAERRRISFIERDHDQRLRPEIYPCNLCWKDDTTLLIGWAHNIKICTVVKRPAEPRKEPRRDQHPEQSLPSRTIIIKYHIVTDFSVCGVAPLNGDLVVLAYTTSEEGSEDEKAVIEHPQLKIISLNSSEFETVTSDSLNPRGYQKYSPCHYSLQYLADECAFYIVSPLDIIVTKQRDQDDRIDWLLDNEQFEEAMEEAKKIQGSLHRYSVQSVGLSYIDHLIENQDFTKAASVCESVLVTDISLWEHQVYQFARHKKLREISTFVPTGDLRLPKGQYEMILNEFLQEEDLEGFKKLIAKWPQDLYDLQTIINAVEDRLKDLPDHPILLHALAELYAYDHHYGKALAIYLKLKHEDVFGLIHRFDLFKAVSDKVVMLMDFDNKKAVDLLINNTDKVPIKAVVDQLQGRKELLYLYLHALFLKDSQRNTEHHERLVALYAEYKRSEMMYFLKISNHYPLKEALDICTERNYVPEMVFLYSRMGNVQKALNLIIDELNDVDRAIAFCKEQDDMDLWNTLIESSLKRPVFITGLLNNIGTHVDPIILIKKIEEGLEIPGLRDSLVKILQDYNLQISLRDGCKNILVSDCFSLMTKLNKMQKKGLRMEDSQSCDFCNNHLFNTSDPSVVVFFCHHAFHEDCLINQKVEHCIICHSQKRGPGGRLLMKR